MNHLDINQIKDIIPHRHPFFDQLFFQRFRLHFRFLHGLCQLRSERWLPVELSSGELLEGCRNGIRVPALEKHQIPGLFRSGILFQREIHMVFFRRPGKAPDVLLRDLDIGKPRVLTGQLL